MIKVSQGASGALTDTIDSVAQGARGFPVASISQDQRRVVFVSAVIKAFYEGALQDDGSIVGTWTQGAAAPLRLAGGDAMAIDGEPFLKCSEGA